MSPHAQVIGPFPNGVDEAEYDRLRRRVLWRMPSGLYLLGSRNAEHRNLMTCNWATQLSIEPKLVGVAVEVGVRTHELIEKGRCFTLSILRREDRAVVRKFVKPAEDDRGSMTLNGVEYRDATVTGAPIPSLAAAFLDCRVTEALVLGSHTLFVGEIVDADEQTSEPIEVLRMEDTRMSYGG